MRNRWLGAAFLGACLGVTAEAQTPSAAYAPGPTPGPVPALASRPGTLAMSSPGMGSMPEPVPLVSAPSMPPMMGPGGMPPGMAQGMPPMMGPGGMPPGMAQGMPSMMGPGHGMPPPNYGAGYQGPDMMHGGPGCDTPACYTFLGAMSLQRERMSKTALAVTDPGSLDTGRRPPANAAVAARFHDMEMDWMVGYRATIGYHWGNHALELSGYYLPQDSSSHTVNGARRLDSFFYNPPVGFEGNNFLWLQADQIRTELRTALGNAELNYRCWTGPLDHFSWLIGVRYLDLWERLRIFTDDEGLTVRDAFGQADQTRQATYTIRTHNRILALQAGFEWNIPLNCFVAATWQAKGAWGANFVEADMRLRRGDGFTAPGGWRDETQFSHLYDAGFYLDWRLHRCAKLRTGYNALWLVHIAEAVDQVDFNLEHTKGGRRKPDGDIFYHGPTIELHLVF